jgi:hypothetical protein
MPNPTGIHPGFVSTFVHMLKETLQGEGAFVNRVLPSGQLPANRASESGLQIFFII